MADPPDCRLARRILTAINKKPSQALQGCIWALECWNIRYYNRNDAKRVSRAGQALRDTHFESGPTLCNTRGGHDGDKHLGGVNSLPQILLNIRPQRYPVAGSRVVPNVRS